MSTEGIAPRAPLCRVKVAIVDSGVHADHPHVGGVAGGVAIHPDGSTSDEYVDRIGHGTAVTAVIREKAPAAEIYAVRIFGDRLATRVSALLAGIDWAIASGMQVVNLSLGTANAAHRSHFSAVLERASAAGCLIVAARDDEGVAWLPGSLPDVVGVQVDWSCPRDQFRVVEVGGDTVFRASGFARPVPGVDPRRNLNGISFAVANMSGFLARALSIAPTRSPEDARRRLVKFAQLPLLPDAAPDTPRAARRSVPGDVAEAPAAG